MTSTKPETTSKLVTGTAVRVRLPSSPIGPATILGIVGTVVGTAGTVVAAIQTNDVATATAGLGTIAAGLATLGGRYAQAIAQIQATARRALPYVEALSGKPGHIIDDDTPSR